MANFKEFAAHLTKHGLARTNRFQVLIPLPEQLQRDLATEEKDQSRLQRIIGEVVKVIKIFTGPSSAEYTRGLDLMCSQTELPGKILNISETKHNGDTWKVGQSVTYGNQQFVFKVSTDMIEKDIIDKWMNLILDPETHEVGYLKDYAVDITVFQLDTNDKIVHGITLKDAYPVMTNPLTLSNLESNNTHELMTQFAYRKWINLSVEKQNPEDVNSLLQTPLGPFLAPILSNPAVQRGLEYVKQNTGLDLEGEAVNIYNQVNQVLVNTTGDSIGKTTTILNKTLVDLDLNSNINPINKLKLGDYITGALDKLGG